MGSAVLAKVKGHEVFLSDMGNITEEYAAMLNKWEIPFEQGHHTEDLILNADEVIKSPGIPSTAPMVRKITEKGIGVISEIEFAGRYDSAKKVCITGSNGKTTTTSLVYHLLKQAGLNVGLGGNIGKSYAFQVATENYDIYVLELSSFQLISMHQSPNIAVVTNVTPNHLDHHKDMQEYIDAKRNILLYQDAASRTVLGWENEVTRSMESDVKGSLRWFTRLSPVEEGACLDSENRLCLVHGGVYTPVLEAGELLLPGLHNIENVLTAMAAVDGEVDIRTMHDVAATFTGVEHRIEPVRTLDGVKWFNDSIASSPTRTIAGLRSFTQKLVLLAGGYDKKISYAPLAPEILAHVKLLILTGPTGPIIEKEVRALPEFEASGLVILHAADMAEAVRLARENTAAGDIVTLSPASASFDAYPNFAVRGRHFKDLVNAL